LRLASVGGCPAIMPDIRCDRKPKGQGRHHKRLAGWGKWVPRSSWRRSSRRGDWMMDEEEVRRILVECLRREEGEAAPDKLIYAYQALRGLGRGGF